MKQANVLLLDCDPAGGLSGELKQILDPCFCLSVQACSNPVTFREKDSENIFSRTNPHVIFLALSSIPPEQASGMVREISKAASETPIIVAFDEGGPKAAFELLKLGAADFIIPPLKATDVLPRVWRLLEDPCEDRAIKQTLKERLGLKQIIGESPAFVAEIKKIPLVAKCDAGVLITGETGTGKEVCARAIHYLSSRSPKPFIPVNCGAIPVDLVENELFGHERGAFTGAFGPQPGLIQEADGGTLFLDEIDCLPLLAQVKLLRFLQEKEYRPLGSTKMSRADVRMIAATNTDCEKAVKEGTLRRDLYYRLNVIPLVVPPLRERREDIAILARHFLDKYAAEFDKPAKSLSPNAMQRLLLYEWPGNVRELEHVIQRALVLSEDQLIQGKDIALPDSLPSEGYESFQEMKSRMVGKFEKSYIQSLLVAYQGNITKAARAAQKNRRAFWELIRKHHIDAQSFKPDVS